MTKIKDYLMKLKKHPVQVLAFILLVMLMSFFYVEQQHTEAGVGTVNAGTLVYGDTTNAGTPKFQNLTYSDTFSAEMAGPAASASGVAHVIAKNAPTRDEVITGQLKVDARLDVHTCTGGCDVAGDMASLFNITGISEIGSTGCNTAVGACNRSFDIAYESLSGKAMIVFGRSTAGTIEYCRWDGSALSPAGCTTPSTFTLSAANCGTAMTGVFAWIRLIAYGEGLKGMRSNDILMIGSDTNNDIYSVIWNGSSWSNCTYITNESTGYSSQNFDGAWENTTGNAMVVYQEGFGASTTPLKYKRWIRSTATWDSSGTALPAQSTSRIGHWVDLAGASQAGKNHIAIMTASATTVGGATGAGVPYIWDGSAMTKGNEWASIESTLNDQSAVAIEALNTNVQALYVSTTGSASDATSYQTWIEGTGFSSVTDVTGGMADDAESHKLISSPNRNDIYLLGSSIDDGLEEQRWGGSGWNGAFSVRETALSPGAVSANTHGPEKGSYDMSIRPYSPWQRNWRFYSGTDTNSTPTTALAAENTSPTNVNPATGSFRLRINYAERAGLGSIDARKKLQYTRDCNPNSVPAYNCTWTDVDDLYDGGEWRYKDPTCTATDCADGTLLTGTVLTGSGACSVGNGCGTWVLSSGNAPSANMDHNASQIQESEWIVESNNAVAGTTYYFRIYNQDQLTPQFTEQDAADCGAGSATCTYPSLSTTARTYEQASYRFFDNTDSTSVATAKASQDTLASLALGDDFRMRLLMHIGGTSLESSSWAGDNIDANGNNSAQDTSIKAVDINTVYVSQWAPSGLRFCKSTNAGVNFTCSDADPAGANTWGGYSSIDIVDANTIYISHYDSTNSDLRFCKSTNAGVNFTCSAAEASANGVGTFSSLDAVDANTIYISHRDQTNSDLRFCKSTNAGVNFTCSVAEGNADLLGSGSSLQATDANNIYISHYDDTNDDLRFCKSTNAGVNFTCSVAEGNANLLGIDSSLQATDANTIYISHYDSTNSDLRFCKSTNAGVNFTCSAAETSPNIIGEKISLAVIDKHNIYISHIDNSNDQLRFTKIKAPTEYFKLQYAQKSGVCDASFSGETYADVTTSTDVQFKNNVTPLDQDDLTPNGSLDPTHLGHTVQSQTYEESNNFTNWVSTTSSGQDSSWDFSLKLSLTASGSSYCIRAVKSNGTLLDTYSVIPEITAAATGPTMDQVMRGGNWFNGSGVKQGFFWAQ